MTPAQLWAELGRRWDPMWRPADETVAAVLAAGHEFGGRVPGTGRNRVYERFQMGRYQREVQAWAAKLAGGAA